MDRLGALQQFIDNWPGRVDMQKCSFLEKKTRWATIEELERGVEIVLEERYQPPAVSDLRSAIMKARAEIRNKALGIGERKKSRDFKPGDVIDGHKTFTPKGAAEEIIRLRELCPGAFVYPKPKADFTTPEGRRQSLEDDVTRLVVSALRRLMRLDPQGTIRVSEFKQPEMF